MASLKSKVDVIRKELDLRDPEMTTKWVLILAAITSTMAASPATTDHSPSKAPHPRHIDVVFVAGPVDKKIVYHRGEQLHAMWTQRATFAHCSKFLDMANATTSARPTIKLFVHIAPASELACRKLPDAWPDATHVFDPIDFLQGADAVIKGKNLQGVYTWMPKFDAVIAMNAWHARFLKTVGARRTVIIPYHTIASAGCRALPRAAAQTAVERLPLVPRDKGTCTPQSKDGHDHLKPGIRVLMPGVNPPTVEWRRRVGDWALQWCDQQGHPVRVLWEYELDGRWVPQCSHWDDSYELLDGAHNNFAPSLYSINARRFFEYGCDVLHCMNNSIALAIAYREGLASLTYEHEAVKPAERLINPLSVGIPAVGQKSHEAMALVVEDARRQEDLNPETAELLLARNASDALSKASQILGNASLWASLRQVGFDLVHPYGRTPIISKYAELIERAEHWGRGASATRA